MPHRIRVGDVMTRNFTYLHPEDSLLKCSKTMIKERVGSIILKEGDKLKGIISMKEAGISEKEIREVIRQS